MAKKKVAVSLRKPPLDDAPVTVGDETPSRPLVIEGPCIPTRAGDRREVTLYLPVDLARRLLVRCAEMDRDVSQVVAEAIAKALEEPERTPQPEARWVRVRLYVAELWAWWRRVRAAQRGPARAEDSGRSAPATPDEGPTAAGIAVAVAIGEA